MGSFPVEEVDKVLAGAERVIQFEQRRQKLRRLQKVERDSDRAAHLAALLGELSNAIELERNLLATLPAYGAVQPNTLPLASLSAQKVIFAFHRAHGRWYPARLDCVAEEGANADVTYIGYDERERLPAAMVKVSEPLVADHFFKDAPCAFIAVSSGRVHAAWVADAEDPRPLLRRKADGLTLHVDHELILAPHHAPHAAATHSNVILPNDPREVRIRKKKAAKRLKYQARSEEINGFFRERQQSWLAFKHRGEERENLFKPQRRA